MKPKNNPFHQFPAAAFATVILALSPVALGQTWDASFSRLWSANDNWSTPPAFDNTTDLLFSPNAPVGMVANGNSMVIGSDLTARSLTFAADVDGPMLLTLQDNGGGVAKSLTMDTDAVGGNTTLDIVSGATGEITIGNAGFTGTFGSVVLADNLTINHNGSGLLNFNRAISGPGFGVTKAGTGTLVFNSIGANPNTFNGDINLNEGKLIANGFVVATDINNAANVKFGGGTLEVRNVSGANKDYTNVGINVTSPSTLVYNNTNATTYTLSFTGAKPFVLNADLAVQNISINAAVVNAINIGRAITGTRNLSVETYNNIAAIGDNFTLGRVSLSGDNSGWSGNIVISKGTVSLGGTILSTNLNAAGTGDIIIGTTGDLFGAGLTFFPGANVTYNNDITVNTGGFRAIKGGGNAFNVTLAGNVTLNKDLTVDHTWSATDKRISLNGAITGVGGLTINRAGGNPGTTVVLAGASDYSGPTTVTSGASLSLARTCSLTSNIKVETGARIGGSGSTTGSLALDPGANYFFFFSASYAPMTVSGTVTLDPGFGVASLLGGSQGEVLPWANVAPGTYTLIGGTATSFNTSTITNFGFANRVVDVGGVVGKDAYFQNGGGTSGGGLQLVVTGPSGYDAWKSTNLTGGGLDEDHDDDGVDNGTEYFLGGNTSTTGFTLLPAITAGSITWPAASITGGYGGVYGIHFTVETSETLEPGSWVTAPIGTGPDTVAIPFAAATAIRNVKYTFPTTGPKKFARLKVTGP